MTDRVSSRLIKQAIRRWAYARAYVIEPKRRLPTLVMAKRLQEIFADYAIDTVIDVGANDGQFASFLRNDVGFAGRIESFEPLPSSAQKLMAMAAADGRWIIHQRAMGAKPGKLPFNVMKDSVRSRFANQSRPLMAI